MKIYVLTEGWYSDYHILAATTNENKAEELKELYIRQCPSYKDSIAIEML